MSRITRFINEEVPKLKIDLRFNYICFYTRYRNRTFEIPRFILMLYLKFFGKPNNYLEAIRFIDLQKPINISHDYSGRYAFPVAVFHEYVNFLL